MQLFVPRTGCLKYQNNISSPKNRIKQKIIHVTKICHVMFSLVLCCSFLYCYAKYLLFCKSNAPNTLANPYYTTLQQSFFFEAPPTKFTDTKKVDVVINLSVYYFCIFTPTLIEITREK